MKPEANAILLMAVTKPSNDNARSNPKARPSLGGATQTKPRGYAEAMVMVGKADWVRFKSECVLLKRKGK